LEFFVPFIGHRTFSSVSKPASTGSVPAK
jgi:hypothetical protein